MHQNEVDLNRPSALDYFQVEAIKLGKEYIAALKVQAARQGILIRCMPD